jgi:hypothetical protein
MPNWCWNKITISGDVTKIVEALESIDNKQEDNVFRTLIDVPDAEDWHNNNLFLMQLNLQVVTNQKWFGTKWDVSHEECDPQEFDGGLVLTPCTAWSPPIEFGVNLAKKYGVEVEMYYHESGMDLCGKTYIKPDGACTEDDYGYMEGIYNFDWDYFWMEIESYIEYAIEEGQSVEEFLKEYTYLSEEDKQELIKLYNEI